MKRIIVCCKWVPDGAEIRIDQRSRSLDLSNAAAILNDFDRNAIEAGVQLKTTTGCELIGITAGTANASSAKDALARGLDALFVIDDAVMATADSRTTAKVLAAMITKLGGADLVLCSEASDDEFAQQTGPRLAALLGYVPVSYVQGMTSSGEVLALARKLENGIEDVEVREPAVVSVVPDINEAPIPSVKQILGAKKKPTTVMTLAMLGLNAADLVPQLRTENVRAPEVKRKRIRLSKDGVPVADVARSLAQQLASDGVL